MPIRDFLNQAARVEARAPKRQGYGDNTPSWALVPGMEAVPCMVRPLRPETVARQGRDAEKTWVRVYFGDDPGTTRNHRLTIDGRIYAVTGEVDFNALGRLFAVDCTEATA